MGGRPPGAAWRRTGHVLTTYGRCMHRPMRRTREVEVAGRRTRWTSSAALLELACRAVGVGSRPRARLLRAGPLHAPGCSVLAGSGAMHALPSPGRAHWAAPCYLAAGAMHASPLRTPLVAQPHSGVALDVVGDPHVLRRVADDDLVVVAMPALAGRSALLDVDEARDRRLV